MKTNRVDLNSAPIPLRVLLLEDNLQDAESEITVLERAGFSCRWDRVEEGETFLTHLDAENYDVILADYHMPGFNGLTALNSVRERSEDLPFILISDAIGEEAAIAALKAGATDYVLRSALSRLGPAVRRALREREEQRKSRANIEALRRSEARFRLLAESIRKVFYIKDAQKDRYDYISPTYEDIWGRSSKGLYKDPLSWLDSVVPEDRDRVAISLEKQKKGESVELDYRISRPDRTIRWIRARTFPVKDESGNLLKIVGVAEDVSTQKKTEEALKESEAKYRQIVDHAPAGICEVDLVNLKFSMVNRVFCKILGYTEKELLSMGPLEVVPPRAKELVIESRKRILSGETVPESFEYLIRAKDGREINTLLNTSVMVENGRPLKAFIIVQDMTTQKKIEEQVRQVQKMEAISTLAGGVAHEFNNALVGATGNLELLVLDFPENKKLMEYADRIKVSIQRMTHLTGQLLAYARGGKYFAQEIRLEDFVRDTLSILRYLVKPGISLETDLPQSTPPVEVDVPQLQMVISAVIQNASEAIEEHGRIRILTGRCEITEESAEEYPGMHPGEYACLTVRDDGRGMDEETKEKIFEPFFTTKFQGRGLGMAAAYGIVKNHGGYISVHSETGQGTEINIYLPVVVPEKKDAKSKPPIPAKGTVLVIDDEESVLAVCRDLLERLGYRVLTAETGKDAVDIAENYAGDIDVALLDIMMPDLGGREIYPLLRKARPNIRVIVCSGYTLDGPAREILDAGAQGFLQKPFTLKAISRMLDENMMEK